MFLDRLRQHSVLRHCGGLEEIILNRISHAHTVLHKLLLSRSEHLYMALLSLELVDQVALVSLVLPDLAL